VFWPQPVSLLPGAGPRNFVIGTQTFGASYQFTRQSRLLETASVIRDMGATVIKFQLSKRYAGKTGISGGVTCPGTGGTR